MESNKDLIITIVLMTAILGFFVFIMVACFLHVIINHKKFNVISKTKKISIQKPKKIKKVNKKNVFWRKL